MERRKAVIAAATASLTLLAGAAAISLNTSLVGASGDDGVGEISPVEVVTVPSTAVDEPVTGTPGSSRSGFGEDDHDDDGVEGDDVARDDEHGDDIDHEYEGADDDD